MADTNKEWAIVAVDPGTSVTVAVIDSAGYLGFYEGNRVADAGHNSAVKLSRIFGSMACTYGAKNTYVICERVFIRPGENLSTGVPFIGSQFMVEGIAAAFGLDFESVTPSAWKQKMKVPGKLVKGANGLICDRAAEIFSNRALFVPPSKMHNRADAALLAEWKRRQLVAKGRIAPKGATND